MRRQARAATAESTQRWDGEVGRKGLRPALPLTLVSLVALLALVFASTAEAVNFQRPFKEAFGSVAQPSFERPSSVAVDRESGDVLVGNGPTDGSPHTISRFHADGTPAPFAALGTNVIDGREANGKPCSEEPASCDKTPQNEIEAASAELTQIAIDESGGLTDGNIYVTQSSSRLVDIFAADGKYLGQISATGFDPFPGVVCGVGVDSGGAVYIAGARDIFKFVPTANPPGNFDAVDHFTLPADEELGPAVCNIALGTGPSAGALFAIDTTRIGGGVYAFQIDKETGEVEYTFADGFGGVATAVDPTTGRVLITDEFGNEIGEFEVQDGAPPVKVSRLVPEKGSAYGFAVNGVGEVLLAGSPLRVFGLPGIVPTLTLDAASDVIGTKATLSGTVNPSGLEVTECVFEYGKTSNYGNTTPCDGAIPTDSEPHTVSAQLSELEPNGVTYHYRLVAKNANGEEESPDRTFVTAGTVETSAATALTPVAATLNGALRPEGLQFSDCHFEYGISTNAGFEGTVPCVQSPGSIPQDYSPHPVSADITGLEAATTYKFRLTATSTGGPFAGTFSGETLTFETQGEPAITEIRASNADQNSVILEAKIAPRGFDTSYRFEWGPTDAYGNTAPAGPEPEVAGNEAPRRVTVDIAGLSPATVYHFRVVAHNEQGTTTSTDQTLETLNSCGLPDRRCFELVSPRDAGPVAIPGEASSSSELGHQAALTPGSLAWYAEPGLLDATKGATVLYRASRGSAGWSSTQISAPSTARNETGEGVSQSSKTQGLSEDLSCGVVESTQPLTADASMRLVFEGGGGNLYRRNPDGSYTGLTKLPPENLEAGIKYIGEYVIDGFSEDCGKVVFEGPYHYPGVPGAGEGDRLYEWDEGALRAVGFVPGPSGEVVVEAIAGAGGSKTSEFNSGNVVSDDGSRVFFRAERQLSANPEEIGKQGIFVREDGNVTRDVSLSQTAIPNEGAVYQWATPDGSRVFFTANAGLTSESSPEGKDLYEYDLESETLTDLSVATQEPEAEVTGFIGGSDDGSRVYFVAKGQLLPGRGKTLAENRKDKTFSVYGVTSGEIGYVGAVNQVDLKGVIANFKADQTSRVSRDGRYLLFESRANITGYDSHTVPEAYLYDAEAGVEKTVCVSCRQDGDAPAGANGLPIPLAYGGSLSPLYAPRTLVVRDGKPQVYFISQDRLAPGGVAGEGNLYEWAHGQVFHVATEPSGLKALTPTENTSEGVTYRNEELYVRFADASADGTDLYFATPEVLTWEDGDERFSIYSARVGGGFTQPPSPTPCDATSEGSCQGSSSQAQSMPGATTNSFNGPGNPKAKKHKKKKHHKKHKKQSGKKKQKNGKRTNANRRAAK